MKNRLIGLIAAILVAVVGNTAYGEVARAEGPGGLLGGDSHNSIVSQTVQDASAAVNAVAVAQAIVAGGDARPATGTDPQSAANASGPAPAAADPGTSAATRSSVAQSTPVAAPLAPVLEPAADALAPVTAPLAPVLEPAAEALAPVTAPLAPVLEPAAEALAPVTAPLAPVLEPVGEALAPVTAPLAPVLEPVGEALAPVTAPLAPVLEPVGEALAPVTALLAPVLEPVGEALAPVTAPLAPVLEPVGEALAPVTAPLAPVLEPVGEALAPVTTPLAPVLEPAARAGSFPTNFGRSEVQAPKALPDFVPVMLPGVRPADAEAPVALAQGDEWWAPGLPVAAAAPGQPRPGKSGTAAVPGPAEEQLSDVVVGAQLPSGLIDLGPAPAARTEQRGDGPLPAAPAPLEHAGNAAGSNVGGASPFAAFAVVVALLALVSNLVIARRSQLAPASLSYAPAVGPD